jgi:hypothetical protein
MRFENKIDNIVTQIFNLLETPKPLKKNDQVKKQENINDLNKKWTDVIQEIKENERKLDEMKNIYIKLLEEKIERRKVEVKSISSPNFLSITNNVVDIYELEDIYRKLKTTKGHNEISQLILQSKL